MIGCLNKFVAAYLCRFGLILFLFFSPQSGDTFDGELSLIESTIDGFTTHNADGREVPFDLVGKKTDCGAGFRINFA